MKRLLTIFLVFAAFTTNAQHKWKTIEGNGVIKKEVRTPGNFTAVENRGVFSVDLTYGETNSVEVEADENLLPYIETKLNEDRLIITTKDKNGISSKEKIAVHVTLSKITALSLSGSGYIKGNGNFFNDGETNISTSGSGSITLGFKSFENITAKLSGSGYIKLTDGNNNNLNAAISGSGDIDASGVVSNNVNSHISGSGNIKVNAAKSIEAAISGSGNVYYKGDASSVSSKVSGSGKLVKG